jgi:hypothetical protein
MKTLFTFLALTFFTLGVSAQLTRVITFDRDTTGNASWYFPTFGNGTQQDPAIPDLAIVENPLKQAPNTSDSVMRFTVNTDAQTWAGTYSDFYGPMEFTADNYMLFCMVNKPVISNVGIKLENSTNGGATVNEIKVPNTVTDEWEGLSFDMTPAIGFTYTRLTFFPDFPDARTEGSICYFDNIYNSDVTSIKKLPTANLVIFPNPVEIRMAVMYPEMKSITVSNVLGKTVMTSTFEKTNSKVLEMGALQTGIYFLTVEATSGTFTSKFLKK